MSKAIRGGLFRSGERVSASPSRIVAQVRESRALSALTAAFSLSAIEKRLGLDRLSDRLRRYTIALTAFVLAVAVSAVLLRSFGTRPALLYSLIFDLVVIGAACSSACLNRRR